MEDIPLDKFVAYYERGILKFGYVTAGNNRYYEIITESNTHFTLPAERFILISKETYPADARAMFFSQVSENEAILPKLNFSFMQQREYALSEIAERLNWQSDAQCFALLKFLRENPAQFHYKKDKYRLKTAEETALYTEMLKEQEMEKQFLQEIDGWFKGAKLSESVQHKLYCLLPELNNEKKNNELRKLILAKYAQLKPEEAITQFRMDCGEMPDNIDPVIAQSGIPIGFSDLLNKEKLQPEDNLVAEETSFCIDEDTTRDYDDAISIVKEGSLWKIGIYVSSVAERLNLKGALFAEAKKRVVTLYTANAVIPLFPPKYSEQELCLLENAVRPVLALTVWVDKNLAIKRTEISRKNISISANYSYNEVERNIANEPFATLSKFCNALATKREADSIPENKRFYYYIRATAKGLEAKCVDTQSPARKMIEELMILYNSALADYALKSNLPIIYRNINHYEDIATNFFVNKAYLSTHPEFHSGIGVKAYTHLTSPLRRYVDLINQSQILAMLNNEKIPFTQEELEFEIPYIEKHLQILKEIAHKSEHYWVLQFIQQNYLNTPLDACVRTFEKGYLRLELIPWGFVISAKCDSYTHAEIVKIVIYKVDVDKGIVWADLI